MAIQPPAIATQEGLTVHSAVVRSANDRVLTQHAALSLMLLLVVLYLMFAPGWVPKITTFRYDNARCLQLGLLVTSACLIALPAVARSTLAVWESLWPPARTLIAVFLAGGAISAGFSGAPQLGALEVALAALLVFLTLSVAAIVRTMGATSEKILAVAFTCGAGFVVLQFWVTQTLYLIEGKAFSWVSPFLEFANVRFFSQYQAYTLLLISLPVALVPLSRALRITVYIVSANFWALQWIVGGRAVWIGLALASVIVALAARRDSFGWIRQQLLLIAAGGLIFFFFEGLLSLLADGNTISQKLSVLDRGWDSVAERAKMANSAVELVLHNLLFGVGPGQFGLHYSATLASHPHNAALQLLSEYGLVAGLGAITALVMMVTFAVRRIKSESSAGFDVVNASLCAALIMGLTDSLFSGNLIMPHSQISLCVVSGWLLGRNYLAATNYSRLSTSQRIERITFVFTVAASAIVLVVLSFEYLNVLRAMPGWLPERYPHFWQYGRFAAW